MSNRTADFMTTYRSVNSAPDQQWLGYIHFYDSGRLNMAFFGATEESVKAEMKAFYAKDKAKRDANREKRVQAKAVAAARAAKTKFAAELE